MWFQYNTTKKRMQRTGVPRVFDTELQTKQAFHAQLSDDMSNTTLDWSVCMIFTDIGSVIASERWEAPKHEPTESEPTNTESETTTEEA